MQPTQGIWLPTTFSEIILEVCNSAEKLMEERVMMLNFAARSP
jgi:hypothetical protein